MSSRNIIALSVVALAQAAFSAGLAAPEPTITKPANVEDGFSPKTTNGPRHELVKRDTALWDTCGWISSSRTMSCNLANTCAFVTSGSLTLQGCCDFGTCYFETTCYDYAQYTSSKCNADCQANTMNVVCSESATPSCRFYHFANGASGFGCNTIGGTVSVTTTSDTLSADITVVDAAALSGSSLRSSISLASLSSYTFPSYTPYSGSSPDYNYGDVSAGLAVAALAPIIVICLLFGCWHIAGLVIIFLMCRRSKRLTAKWDQPGGVNYRGPPMDGSNIVAPYAVPMATGPQQAGMLNPHQSTYYGNDKAVGMTPPAQSVSPVSGPGSPAPSYATSPFPPPQGTPAQPYVYPNQQPQQPQQFMHPHQDIQQHSAAELQ